MFIRPTVLTDLPRLRVLFEQGRQRQIKDGNPNQWESGYPSSQLLEADIQQGYSYVCVVQDESGQENIVGSYYLSPEPDPTYQYIEGEWIDDLTSYVTVHRIVADEQYRGVGRFCLTHILAQHPNVRIDTHCLNQLMKRLVLSLGFQYCGVIYLANGDARQAFQWLKVKMSTSQINANLE